MANAHAMLTSERGSKWRKCNDAAPASASKSAASYALGPARAKARAVCATSWALNSSARRAACSPSAAIRRGAGWRAVEKAHAVLARPCAEHSIQHGMAWHGMA